MQVSERTLAIRGVAVAAALAMASVACSRSDAVTAPAAAPAGASVAGSWTGDFQPYSQSCAGSSVSARFEQNGSEVTGLFAADACGIRGAFHGTVAGNALTGRVEMPGCSGGAVSGTLNGSAIVMTIGDFTRPVVSGDSIVMYGGAASLHR